MKCVFCNHDLEKGVQTIERRVRGQLHYISNVPVDLCNKCGEVYIDDSTVTAINKILKSPELSQSENSLQFDFAILNGIQLSKFETSATTNLNQFVSS